MATCPLCGKRRGYLASRRNICRCRSMLECAACHTDTWIKEECRSTAAMMLAYGCQIHGTYRAYKDQMSKKVSQIAFTVMAGMIPIFIIFYNIAVASRLYFGLCTPFVGCLCLSILWARLSKVALLIGYFISAGASLTIWFALDNSSTLETKHTLLVGLGVAFLGGFLLPALITVLLTKLFPPEVALNVWSCVQEIDNPLFPWPEIYARQTDLRFSPRLSEKKPALSEVRRALGPLRRLTCGIVVFSSVIFLGPWQMLGHAIQKLDVIRFFIYVRIIEIWTYLSTVFCVAFPMVLLVSHQRKYLRRQFHRLRMVIRHRFFCLRR